MHWWNRLAEIGRSRWFAAGLALALALLLYGPALNQPFYFDDASHFYIVVKHSFAQIWTNQAGYEYYRPLIFSLYKIIYGLPLPWPLWVGHGLAILLHVLNAVFAGELIFGWLRLRKSDVPESLPPLARWLTAVLFVVVPSAALTVQYLAAIMHLVVGLVALTGAWAAVKFLADGRLRWWVVMVSAAVLAPWAHEAGVVVGPLIAFTLVIGDIREGWRCRKGIVLGLILPSLLFMTAWLLIPKSRGGVQWIGWEALWKNLIFFAQGATFPTQPLAVWLGGGGDPAWPTLLAALGGLALLIGGLWWCRQRGLWGFSLLAGVWAVAGSAPSILMLSFTYVIAGLRLWYFPLALAVPVWAGVAAGIIELVRRPSLRFVATAALVLGLSAYAFVFDLKYIALAETALSPIRDVAKIAQTYPRERHLVINPVSWVAYQTPAYALANTGVPVMPMNATLSQLAQVNTGYTTWFDSGMFPPVRTAMASYYTGLVDEAHPLDWAGLAALAPHYDRVWLTTYVDDHIAIEEAGAVTQTTAQPPATYLATWDNKVYLLDGKYHLEGTAQQITLKWKYLGPDPDATVFRHMLDCEGNMLGVGDGYVVGRMLQWGFLLPGMEVRDIRRIPLDSLSADGCYQVSVGLYLSSGERLQATAPDGTRFENDAVSISSMAP